MDSSYSSDQQSAAKPRVSPDGAPLVNLEGKLFPPVPESVEKTGTSETVLRDMALKLSSTVPRFTTQWAAERLHLPLQLTEHLYWSLKQDHLIEVLGQEGPFSYRYAVTDRGNQAAARSFEICGYVGPAPVSLKAYTDALHLQHDSRPQLMLDEVREAISGLVLPEHSVQIAALAALSARSLFLFGPAGNGKTSLGRMLHQVFEGDLWIPHCIAIDNSIIRIYDPEVHEAVETDDSNSGKIDRRWILIKRPFLVAGGEMTMDELDLAYSQSMRFYESPPHLKANGGTFLIDDFGRQRIEPHELLNRWIVPLENQIDHLTLHTGQKIQIPFKLMLIVATNLQVSDVADPAFLRRMGYRLFMDKPDAESYAKIFKRYASSAGTEASDERIKTILERYKRESRELRASEPRDLIERARDICRLHQKPLQLTDDVMDLAWEGYFGNAPT